MAMAQAGSTDGPKVKAALENLNAPYDGAIATFVKPYTPTDHEAIHQEQVVMGVVDNGRVAGSLPAPTPGRAVPSLADTAAAAGAKAPVAGKKP
jgi:branched-chain amino acid transport system substrate-binding protein